MLSATLLSGLLRTGERKREKECGRDKEGNRSRAAAAVNCAESPRKKGKEGGYRENGRSVI